MFDKGGGGKIPQIPQEVGVSRWDVITWMQAEPVNCFELHHM